MSITFRKWCGIICGLVMFLCVLATIKIGHNEMVAEWAFDKVGISQYTPHKYVFVATLFLFWWVYGKVMDNIEGIWINWGRICFSVLMFIAMISFFYFT